MIPGVSGRLITASFAETRLATMAGAASPPAGTVRALHEWSTRRGESFGPASSVRAIADGIAIPLLKILGFSVARRVDESNYARLEAAFNGTPVVPVTVAAWDQPLDTAWRHAVLDAVRADERWAFVFNGTSFRIVDAHHTWTRQYVEFDLSLVAPNQPAFDLLWRLARAESLGTAPRLLDRAVELSARHGVAVCSALSGGVLDALEALLRALTEQRRHTPQPVLLEQCLTVLYRVLFLLFAEARGLVPIWHPVYRDRYTIDSIVAALLAGRHYRGISSAINAISRLAHAGCVAGELKVTAFNGRLFSPAGTGTFDRAVIGDRVMSEALLSVATTPAARGVGRQRIVYRDLDVEELGAVYEQVLDYEPRSGTLARTRDLRKSTGAFYTPRALTAHLVRETLVPLLANRSAEQILELRILDPAMGSGAFLVAACGQLAAAAEEAMVREGRWHRSDVSAADRVALRREIAQRCLFGVDLNPTAVQVARLSLWLATLAAEKPLTFLDHRLVSGNSLVGASLSDVWRQPGGGCGRGRRSAAGASLFSAADFVPVLQHAVQTRMRLAREADDSAAIVRAKEKTLASLQAASGTLGRYGRVLDLWCAGWFWPGSHPPDRGSFGGLVDVLLERPGLLPPKIAKSLLETAANAAEQQRFLHWPLTFPEIFTGEDGEPLANPGFDAIVGNPPWDMVRGDSGDPATRVSRRDDARCLTDFVRGAGIYRVDTRSHVNRYQLFVERALQLARHGGRIGLVLPAGTMTDNGCAPLRRHLFDHAAVDSVDGFDNRHAIFPVHRSVRFVLLTATNGAVTDAVRCRFGLGRPEELERPGAPHQGLRLTRAFIARLSGDDDLAVPEIRDAADLRILEQISARVPPLEAPEGWHVRFGRELNATDDRHLFVPATAGHGRAVLEGKQIEPFRVSLEGCRYQLRDEARVKVPRKPRLAYRDIASATNRLTLIAAVVPADAVTTHTLFCLKTPLALDTQHVLCALLNSFVANYLIRFRVNTHVTVALVSRLRVPALDPESHAFRRLSSLSRTLMHSPSAAEQQPEYAELQAIVAALYGLSEGDFRHVLGTFPLIPESVKSEVLLRFNNLHSFFL